MSSEPDLPRELKDKYLAEIPKKLSDLERLINDFKAGKTKEQLEALRFFVHKMAGSAGLYGYMAVSDTCKEWEGRLVGKIGNFSNRDLGWMKELDSLMKRVREGFHGE